MRSTPIDTTRDVAALASARWLEEHLGDPNLRVVEVDVSPAAHEEGHIPGAVLWNIYRDLKDEEYAPRPLAAIERLIRDSGIDADSLVVFYGYAPALGFWLMQRCGHRAARVLDTGRDTWRSEGRPWTVEPSRPEPTAFRVPAEVDTVRASRATVEAAIGSADHTILDVRSDLEYVGERFWPSGGIPEGGRAGRIPSAVHVPIDGLVGPDGAFRPPAQLAEILSPVDLAGDGPITTYCTVGARAATAWFALTELLGRDNVRVYDGSWAEWGMSPTTPIERG